jgi:hypothetical protein
MPNRSDLFLGLLAPINARAVALPDVPALRRELCGLERRRGLAGRDRIVPAPQEHDDQAVAVAGLVDLLAPRRRKCFEGFEAVVEAWEREMAALHPKPGTWTAKNLGIQPAPPRRSTITCSSCGAPDDGSIPGPWLMRPGPDWNLVHTCPRCQAGVRPGDPEGGTPDGQ